MPLSYIKVSFSLLYFALVFLNIQFYKQLPIWSRPSLTKQSLVMYQLTRRVLNCYMHYYNININIFHDILGLTIMSLNSYLTKNNVHGGSKYCHSTINKFSFISGTIRWLIANESPILDLQRLQIDLFICVAQIKQVNNFYGIRPKLNITAEMY